MRVDLAGQVALVRGAEGPWGGSIAERLDASGARVVTTGSAHQVCRDAGRLDILVNADPLVLSGSTDAFDAVRTAMAFCDAAATTMIEGRIVNVGSIFGLVPGVGTGHVAAASAAMFVQTRVLAIELAPRGVRVNGIAAMIESRPHTPLGREARPADIATAALFLVAAESSYVVGEIIRVDGGWSCGFARQF